MLDLAKPLGVVEGLTLYGDHAEQDLVYFMPDEIGLVTGPDGAPDVLLQVFYPDEAVRDDDGSLADAVGSILSLGVRCVVSPERLARTQRQLGDGVRLAAPPWEDGQVSLLLLDAAGAPQGEEEDRLVLSVAGTRRPSLSDGNLSALFHARLDRRGTALLAAALAGEAGSNAGVLYDLSYAALRPEVQLRMRADLDACATAIRTGLGVQVYYVSADVSATFAQMRERGDIDVEVIAPVADAESQKLVDEAVRDFYDVLMRELFRPALSPADAAAMMPLGGGTVQTAPVRLSFAYTQSERERVVSVDYRKRSGARRTHNPAAHLRALGELAGGERLIQRVPLSAAWREASLEVAAPAAFEGDPSLLGIEVVLWRGKDGVLASGDARDGGLRMPEAAVPLADLGFARGDGAPRQLHWVSQPAEPPFYHWQARLTYAGEDGVDSPAQIWSDPRASGSTDLDVFPAVLAPRKRVELRLGGGHDATLTAVEADVTARGPDGGAIAQERLIISAQEPEQTWEVRRGELEPVELEAALTYRYAGGRRVAMPAQALVDAELIANSPFATSVELAPLVAGSTDGLAEIVFTASHEDAATGYRFEERLRLRAPDFEGEPVAVPVLGAGDAVAWSAVGITTSGEVRRLGSGTSAGGLLVVQAGSDRRVRVEWLGGPLEDEGLRWVRVTLRVRDDAGAVVHSGIVEWRDPGGTESQVVTVPATGKLEFSVERRTAAGRDTDPFLPVEGDVVPVLP
jgi:hypothetical protein